MVAPRLRRSALYVPGNKPRALDKAAGLAADVLILDLEDAVGGAAKQESREQVCHKTRTGAFVDHEVAVRVNGRTTAWHADDVALAAISGADAILVPKVETAAEVHELERAIAAAGAPPEMQLWAMIETPRAVLNVGEIASASERLSVLVVGTNDLVNDLQATHRPARMPILTALSLAVLGAKAAGKVILDGVYNEVADADGFTRECQQGRDMGFDGKTLIHPMQIELAHEVFTPSPDEVAYAERVVGAYQAAEQSGNSVILVDGKLVEMLHVRGAQRILALERAARERTAS